jgi:hypothetical protein
MQASNVSLMLDLVEWAAKHPRTYDEAMDAWRTSCPRLSIWEDAIDYGLIERVRRTTGRPVVNVTAHGHAFLLKSGREERP